MHYKKIVDKQGISIYDMANIDKRDTKLSVNIWVDSAGSSRHTKHSSPRVKIQKEANNDNTLSNLIPVSISKTPQVLTGTPKISAKELKEVFDFISRNCDVLIQHWNNEITDKQLLNSLK